MKRLVLALLCLTALSRAAFGQQLYINEIMASNAHSLADDTGNYEDWFEIYNPNAFPVNIGGYYVTDKLTNHTKYRIPTDSSLTVIPANGYLVLWASEALARGPRHVNFKLSADGESVGLYRPDGSTVDEVSFGAQRTDVSWGRKPDGSSTWLYFSGSEVSGGSSNNDKTGYTAILNHPTFSQTGGFYSSAFTLSITSSDTSATIYYTLDGSDPDPGNLGGSTFQYKNSYREQASQPDSNLLSASYQTYAYSGPLTISDQTGTANKVSLKSSTFNNAPGYFPTSPVFKGTVVRAIAYKAGTLTSDIVTQTYFITPASPARYTIPVVSIATNEKSFFDYNTGIYNAGKRFDDWRNGTASEASSCTPGNYINEGVPWERVGNVEFFMNNSSIINQGVSLRINGGCSRSFPQKSLRLYGAANFAYPFFTNRPATQLYDRLLLRNAGNDWNYSLIVDAYMQTMVRHLKFDTQSNRASVLFVNGEYWGVHNLYERYDTHYLNRNYAVDTDSVDIISTGYDPGAAAYSTVASDGDRVRYDELINYFSTTNPVSYSYVNTQIDLANFTDYHIAEIFAANTDWPMNNQQFWRKRVGQYSANAAYGHDGRFRWMLKDLDFGLSCVNSYTNNTLELTMQTHAVLSGTYNLFFRRLLDLPDYKAQFINRYADLLNTTFNPTRTVDLLTAVQQEYQPYMAEHFDRWKSGTSYTDWLDNVNNIKTFVQQRPAYARDHIRAKFSLDTNRNVTINVSNASRGYVRVNTIDILPTTVGVAATPYPWTGVYFQGNPIRVVAKARTGYRFVSWQEDGTVITTDTAYSYNPTSDRTLTAFFEPIETPNLKPASFTLSACDYRFNNWPATAPAGTYPANMYLVSMNQEDPTLSATFAIADTVKGTYNRTSSTRINGLDANGLAFINTGGTNPGYKAASLGGAVLALRTTGVSEASVQWTGGTVTPNPRQYAIRLRYRVGDSGPFTDLLNANNQPVEYVRNATAGHSQVIGPVALPASLLDKPYVQLLWQYYYTGTGASGARDQLRIDDIVVSRGKCQSVASGNWNNVLIWGCGRVPTSCDTVVIGAGHTVTITGTGSACRSIEFGAAAQLRYVTGASAIRIQR